MFRLALSSLLLSPFGSDSGLAGVRATSVAAKTAVHDV